ASEMVVRAAKEDLDVAQLEINYLPREGSSKLSSFSDGWRHIKYLLVSSPTALFMVPGATLLVLGAIGMLISGLGVSVFGREWQLHTMIAAALATIIGLQVVSLALSARTFGVNSLGEKPDRLLSWGARHLWLERGLLIGGIFLLLGVAVAGRIVLTWVDRGFGQLSEEKEIVFAAVLIIAGVQVISTSFFLSILGLARQDGPAKR
ncbi:MAG: hypothetical protein QOD60_1162, partial [Solirubrobacterales bacterium]|nr:hypothetical protein [Solirubrobacterales bacterium]